MPTLGKSLKTVDKGLCILGDWCVNRLNSYDVAIAIYIENTLPYITYYLQWNTFAAPAISLFPKMFAVTSCYKLS